MKLPGLEVLAKSTVPATLIWGEKDAIAVPAISDYVWENYLRDRPAPATYWRIPCAGHYLQNDQPEIIAQLIRHALGDKTELDLSESACLPNQVEYTGTSASGSILRREPNSQESNRVGLI